MEGQDTPAASGTASPPPFFTLDLSPRYPVRHFATRNDLKDWLLGEQNFFAFISADPRLRPSGPPFADLAQQVDLYVAALTRLKTIEDNEQNPEVVANNLRKLHNHLKTNYVDGSIRCLMSDDPKAAFISELWAQNPSDPRVAAWALHSFMGRPSNMNDPQVFEGYTRAILFNLGIHSTAESQSVILTKLHGEYQSRLDVLDAKRRDLITATDVAMAGANTSAEERAKQFEDAQAARTDEFSKLRDESKTAFDLQRNAFNEHMSLKAPVTYWRKKATMHAIWGGVFAVTSIAFLGVYVWGAVTALPGFIELLREATAAASTATDAKSAQPVPVYVALFAVALIGVWLMRILVRLTLSHIHLGTDAKHRSVCVESYLALLSSKEKAIGDDERKIILTQLFRPTSDGLVRDDAMPPTLFERITNPRS